jgi:hypothetical protein
VLPSAPITVRFVGGPFDNPDRYDWDGVLLETITNPPRRIRLQSRYVGKVIGASDTDRTTTICTYVMDGDAGMAKWSEDQQGNITVTAFDYPG